MCTRCVRFTREITQTAELQVINRGSHAEISTFPDQPLDNPLAGNVVDLCPVGALLDKDFLHKQRYWFLDHHDSVCTRCSTGCNINVEENRGQVWRFQARYNPHVNDFWICDEGRYSYKAANDPALLSTMYVREGAGLKPVPVEAAIAKARSLLTAALVEFQPIVAVISPFLTVEEAFLAVRLARATNPKAVVGLGPVPTQGEDLTISPDKRKGRTGDTSFIEPRPFTIHAEKCPNRKGVELVLQHFQGEVIPFEALVGRIGQGEFKTAFITGGGLEPAFTEADAQAIRAGVQTLIVEDCWPTPLAQAADVVLNGAGYAERAGCYVNADGRLQYSGAALPPRDGSLPDLDLISILMERQEMGPISSRSILEELARIIPAFAKAAGGEVPGFGLVIDGDEKPAPNAMPNYVDPWHAPRGKPTLVADIAQ
jgi:NADH-quinone oxidoreductase subunit G